jgi:hypothetical protein
MALLIIFFLGFFWEREIQLNRPEFVYEWGVLRREGGGD